MLARTAFGLSVIAAGVQASVVRYSGLSLPRITAATYVIVSLVAAVVGLILTSTVTVYIPSSGNAFLLNAIGATFIGTTFDRHGRPNIPGTALGVLLLGIVANGLLLSGLNFYWQQVGTGLLIFSVLAIGFGQRKSRTRLLAECDPHGLPTDRRAVAGEIGAHFHQWDRQPLSGRLGHK